MTEITFNWSLDAELNDTEYRVSNATSESGTKEILLTFSSEDDGMSISFTIEEAALVGEMLSIAAAQYVEDDDE